MKLSLEEGDDVHSNRRKISAWVHRARRERRRHGEIPRAHRRLHGRTILSHHRLHHRNQFFGNLFGNDTLARNRAIHSRETDWPRNAATGQRGIPMRQLQCRRRQSIAIRHGGNFHRAPTLRRLQSSCTFTRKARSRRLSESEPAKKCWQGFGWQRQRNLRSSHIAGLGNDGAQINFFTVHYRLVKLFVGFRQHIIFDVIRN